jgi:hypothetical protein
MSLLRTFQLSHVSTAAVLLVLIADVTFTHALPMTTWKAVDLDAASEPPPPSQHETSMTGSTIMNSIAASTSSHHILTSGAAYLPATLTLSDSFFLLFRRIHRLGFTDGVPSCLAVFWTVVGITIVALWLLTVYIRRRESEARLYRDRTNSELHNHGVDKVTVEIKISTRPSKLNLSPRSALSSPERRASNGLISPKSVRWAEQLENDQPLTPPPLYHDVDKQLWQNLSASKNFEQLQVDDSSCSSPGITRGRRRYSTAYGSDRVQRDAARLEAGGTSQDRYDALNNTMLLLEGDIA